MDWWSCGKRGREGRRRSDAVEPAIHPVQPSGASAPPLRAAGGRRALRDRGGQTVWAWQLRYSLPMAATTLLLLACGETRPESYTWLADDGASPHS
jgi:hypothetical protein